MTTEKIVAVRFFCTNCGKEIWRGLAQDTKKTLTVAEAERTAICWDCLNKEEGFTQEEGVK